MDNPTVTCPRCGADIHVPADAPQVSCASCELWYKVLLQQGCLRLQPVVPPGKPSLLSSLLRIFFWFIEPFPSSVRATLSPFWAVTIVIGVFSVPLLILILMGGEPSVYSTELIGCLQLVFMFGLVGTAFWAGLTAHSQQEELAEKERDLRDVASSFWRGTSIPLGKDLRALAEKRGKLQEELESAAPQRPVSGSVVAWLVPFLASTLLCALPMAMLEILSLMKGSSSDSPMLICLLPPILLFPLVALWRWLQLRRYRRRRRRFIEGHTSLLTEEWKLWARIQRIEAAQTPGHPSSLE